MRKKELRKRKEDEEEEKVREGGKKGSGLDDG